jgi:3-phenylpropionate/cinnamic acid dioxygenase small subunit
MVREAIQIETNRQLQRLNRTNEKSDKLSIQCADSRIQLTDRVYRVLTIVEARLRK